MTHPPLRIAIAGLGTVGAEVARQLTEHRDLIAARAGRAVEVVAVSARDRAKDRGVDLSGAAWAQDPVALATMDGVELVVELMGGAQGPARALVEGALQNGRPVVTANKALLAEHGAALARAAEASGAALGWEAAVAGGIPVVQTLREGLAANRVSSIAGILNGTCNYILTRMEAEGAGFADVLKDAQDLGYAEADPSFDVGGVDAGHKLALLAALGFGVAPDTGALPITGIESVTAADIAFAGELGYAVRLLGLAEHGDGGLSGGVEPCLVPRGHALAGPQGPDNAVSIAADPVGRVLLVGPGAGAGPTASAVLSDIVAAARGCAPAAVFGVPAQALKPGPWADPGATVAPFYLRLSVTDAPGVIAAVAAALAGDGISIDSFLQHGRDPGGAVAVVLTTHEAPRAAVTRACAAIAALPTVREAPQVLRILAGA